MKRAIVVLELIQLSTRHNVASGTQEKQAVLVWMRLWDVHECLGFVHLELGSRGGMVKQGFGLVCLAHVHVVVCGKQEVRVSGGLGQIDGLLFLCQVGKGGVVARLAVGIIDSEFDNKAVASKLNHAVDMGNDLGEGGRVQQMLITAIQSDIVRAKDQGAQNIVEDTQRVSFVWTQFVLVVTEDHYVRVVAKHTIRHGPTC